jgi:hypothetical protein
MAHYAELNSNNEVINIIYMDNEIITDENGEENEELGIIHLHEHHGSDRKWVRTSYNRNFRGNYASFGDTYREDIDAFIKPQPYPSWTLNLETAQWEPPIPDPSDEINWYDWDEDAGNWILIVR